MALVVLSCYIVQMLPHSDVADQTLVRLVV